MATASTGDNSEYIFTHLNYTVPYTSGGSGTWITTSDIWVGHIYYIPAPNKINLMGESHFYMDISELNNIDETSPYNVSAFTLTTNQTNGIVNSAFAKIPVITTPLSQWFDKDQLPYKYYYPPAERMRKFHIRFRYHNGMLVDFGTFNYSITIEFTLQVPQILRNTASGPVTAQIYPPTF